jgi:CubicO group peptidase (beta-lactamase class C family)
MQANIWSKAGMPNSTFRPELRASYPVLLEMGTRANGAYDPLSPSKNPFPFPTIDELGGAGMYSTGEDYGKFLMALLSDGVLLKRESMEEFIKPHLTEASKEALRLQRMGQRVQVDVSSQIKVDHALGGIVLLEDLPGRRKAGSLHWDGMTNPCWVSRSLPLPLPLPSSPRSLGHNHTMQVFFHTLGYRTIRKRD